MVLHCRSTLNFRADRRFIIIRGKNQINELLIKEASPRRGSTGFLSVSQAALPALDELLFHPGLRHPNDLLDRITTYHKLFQFSFTTEGSSSITSDLILRKDVLSEVRRYYPALAKRETAPEDQQAKLDPIVGPDVTDAPSEKSGRLFKSRLAARANDQGAYQVDYDALFSDGETKSKKKPPTSPVVSATQAEDPSPNCFMLPMMAGDIKASDGRKLRCDFDTQQIQILRKTLLADRESEFFLGIEILDCIYRKSGKLHTFRFPLYYLRVNLEESGRSLRMIPEGNRIFFNHLGLANLVESFSKSTAGRDVLDDFFKALSSQTFQVEDFTGRVRIMRRLPVHEDVFMRTREILIGYPGENGKGGLLGGLDLVGIECDLETVGLYKTPKPSAPTVSALETDLDYILEIASREPQRFYESLLGGFLTPGVSLNRAENDSFAERVWIPGALPKSTRQLLERTNDHNLVLLEGPPGTGKTFTIINLLIHCVASGKRLLVVSDKQAAIQALVERLQEYLLGKDRQSIQAKQIEALWRAAIKVIDLVPSQDTKMAQWVNQLRTMLRVDSTTELNWPVDQDSELANKLDQVDQKLNAIQQEIDQLLAESFGRGGNPPKVALKQEHPSHAAQCEALLALIRSLERDRDDNVSDLVGEFIRDRRELAQADLESCYSYFDVIDQGRVDYHQQLASLLSGLELLLKEKPRRTSSYEPLIEKLPDSPIKRLLEKHFHDAFVPDGSVGVRTWRLVLSLFEHPLHKLLRSLHRLVSNQVYLFASKNRMQDSVWNLLAQIHQDLRPDAQAEIGLAVELAQYLADEKSRSPSIQELLDRIEDLQLNRDELVRKRFLAGLGRIGQGALDADEQGRTNLLTSILACLDNLEAFDSMTNAGPVLQDLQTLLYNTFPVWICHKRAVSFLFPCLEQSFDLIIVDEATQCRVDDALPLLYRAHKLMAVGDERQTVLDKDSVIDDYIFRDFDLDEHLRTAQAHGIKGGGSHLFGLVKRIKQASVLLDEHYRCRPDIIAYSNRYVYNDELRIMQWNMAGANPAVLIDFSEQNTEPPEKKQKGSFRGVDTEMVDRFFGFVERTIIDLEKKTGQRISIETDVALCYFLLKNDTYVKNVKSRFLAKLRRGRDVLDGAGAALQGKERDYIFYLWDVTRHNLKFFAMGDDITKRKGELNVLMTRAKRGVFHYLHRDFDKLVHNRSTITEYLWQTYQLSQSTDSSDQPLQGDSQNLRDVTGKFLLMVLQQILKSESPKMRKRLSVGNCQFAVVVGDPTRLVDLVLLPTRKTGHSIGLVDLSGFAENQNAAQAVVDHYFQLKRAIPKIEPVFAFFHEIAQRNTHVAKRIRQLIESS